MVVTIEKFIEELRMDHLGHYVPRYDGKAYTLAVFIEDEFWIGHNNGQEVEFATWCQENCDGEWAVHNEFWAVFELDTDAIAFKLRWE